MQLHDLKQNIENNSVPDTPIIFLNSENDFIARQYLDAIARIKALEIRYVENLDDLQSDGIFAFSEKILKVYITPTLEGDVSFLPGSSNIAIITDKISLSDRSIVDEFVVEVPKLEKWQIQDFVYSQAKGVSKQLLDNFLSLCEDNIYRIESELAKITLFDEAQQQTIFEDLLREESCKDLSSYKIYDLTNAIQVKDINKIKSILLEQLNIDIEGTGLITILYQCFRKLILVWTDVNPTPESTGLKSNQIWAIKNLPKNYTQEQLLKIFDFITLLDYKVKNGELPVNMLIDYIIVKVVGGF